MFSEVEDPRREQGKRHNLGEMILMALMAVLSGADGWIAVERFCESQRQWLQRYLTLRSGIPTHDTFERVFAVLDPKALSRCLGEWLQQSGLVADDKVIALDGKTLRGSLARSAQQSALHLLHAFGTDSGLLLGQEAVQDKENEIVGMPRLLAQLELRGRTVTADAMGCQKEVAKQVTHRGGDYVLSLKDNHPKLHEHVRQRFEYAERFQWATDRSGGTPFGHHRHQDIDGDHGRIEERCVDVLDATGPWMHQSHRGWSSVKSVARVTAQRTLGDKTSCEQRYFLCSLPTGDAQGIAAIVRAHWAVENKLHWTLDTAFGEDACRIRKDHGAHNLATLRRVSLSLLRRDKSSKVGIKMRRQIAAWNADYRAKILGFF